MLSSSSTHHKAPPTTVAVAIIRSTRADGSNEGSARDSWQPSKPPGAWLIALLSDRPSAWEMLQSSREEKQQQWQLVAVSGSP